MWIIQRMMIVHHYTPRLQRGLPVGLSVVVGEGEVVFAAVLAY